MLAGRSDRIGLHTGDTQGERACSSLEGRDDVGEAASVGREPDAANLGTLVPFRRIELPGALALCVHEPELLVAAAAAHRALPPDRDGKPATVIRPRHG